MALEYGADKHVSLFGESPASGAWYFCDQLMYMEAFEQTVDLACLTAADSWIPGLGEELLADNGFLAGRPTDLRESGVGRERQAVFKSGSIARNPFSRRVRWCAGRVRKSPGFR